MKRSKRILAALVAVCVLIGAVVWPDGAGRIRAEASGGSEDFEYRVLNGTVQIVKCIKSDAEIVVIPEEIEGKQVTSIGDSAFYGCESLTEISIPEGVTSIGDSAFRDCTSLTEISIPERVTSIDEMAFYGCESLTEISIPEGVTVLSSFIFLDCKKLKKISIPERVTSIGKEAFGNCKSLTEISIPSRVTSIGELAFVYCTSLTEISIPEGVTNIERNTFQDCTSLTKISIPKSVTSIERNAFSSCESLTEISIPKGVASIKENVFYDCFNLLNIYVDTDNGSYVSEDGILFNREKTELVRYPGGRSGAYIIPSSVASIGQDAFGCCRNLTGINIPSRVTSIGKNAFVNCESLTEISIPEGVASIGDYAFEYCVNLAGANIPKNVTSIAYSTFRGCKSLAEINIPEGVASISNYAFYGCSNLKDVYYAGTKEQWGKIEIDLNGNDSLLNAAKHFNNAPINDPTEDYEYQVLSDGTIAIIKYNGTDAVVEIPAEIDGKSVTRINEHTFEDSENITEIIIPASVIHIENGVFKGLRFEKITVDPDNAKYVSEDGVLFNKDKTQIIRYPTQKKGKYSIPSTVKEICERAFYECNDLSEIIIPDSVTDIGEFAFAFCFDLTDIAIPNNVTSIKKGTFFNCLGLTKIVIPDGVLSIGESVFDACQFLTEVVIPNSVTDIGLGAFLNCSNLAEIEIPNSVISIGNLAFESTGLTKIIIPDGVTNIGNAVFSYCRDLKEVVIPVAVTKIGNHAFAECNSLKDVYYSGTKEQWDKIEIGNVANEALVNAVIHYKDDPVPTPEEIILPETVDAKQELAKLKAGDPFSLNQSFQHYLSEAQIDVIETCLYTWLAEINYAYKYSGNSGIRERIMRKAGIDPQGDFASGTEQAITHISVKTSFGIKTFEFTLGLGKPDDSGNLYPAYGTMHYEVLEKGGIPSDVPASGQIGKSSYTDMGTFIGCVSKASEDSFRSVHQWKYLSDGMVAGILVDKTVTEIIGIKNGFFFDGSFVVYVEPLFKYSKRVKVTGPVNIYVYRMDGSEAGAVVDGKTDTGKVNARLKAAAGAGKRNAGRLDARLMAADGDSRQTGADPNVRFDVNGKETTVYLTGNDYYLNLYGTDTGKLNYEVEEIANEDVQRSVQFLEMQLKKDMQYEGYVFRPLNIDRDLYALRTVGGSSQEVFYPSDEKQYQALSLFKRVQGLSLGQQSTSLYANRTVQLDASLYPLDASNPNLQWTTDNGAVVKVDGNGLVTAVGSGRATVTVSTKDGSFLKQFCVIDVADKGSSGGTSGGSSSGGWPGGAAPSTGQGSPVVVNLHYVLQFNANGGTSLSRKTMTLLADDSPGIMPKVKRKDYTFDGWYTGQDGGTKVTGDKPLKEATTLYARWTKTTAPAKVAAPTLQSKKKGQIRVSFKNVSGAAGYQAQYSTSKEFKSAKVKEAGASSKVKTLTGLKAGKKYYVRVRAYTVDSMKNRIYGAYSTVKSVKVKG